MLRILLLLLIVNTVSAQNTPGGSARTAATPLTTPASYANIPINYIRTWIPVTATSDDAYVTAAGRTIAEVQQTTQYFDGLGRLIQTVSKSSSAAGNDFVSPVIYDALGREQLKYLPFSQQSDGKFKTAPFSTQATFYQNNSGTTGESVFYSRTDYEASPFNRVLKSYSPGNSWAKNDAATVERGGNKPIETQYLNNTSADSVCIWTLTDVIPVNSGIYTAGQLDKAVTIDEAGNQSVVYKDKQDRMVMKKTQLAATPGTAHTGWLCTYYVYDNLGNLRFVIPPKAVEALNPNWSISAAISANLCYIYRYDRRNRVIVKKVAGADSTEMVYDTRDRIVFSREGSKPWIVTFYDVLNRPVMTAIYNQASTRAALQTSMDGVTSGSMSVPYTFPATADLVVGNYDGSTLYQASNSVTFVNGFESTGNSEITAQINTAITGATETITATNPLPDLNAADLTPLTYIYYDNYSFTGKAPYETSDINKPEAGTNTNAESLPSSPSILLRNVVTGTKTRILDTDKWITNTIYYNDKNRVIQTISDDNSGAKVVETNLYDFSGKLLSSFQKHTNARSNTTSQTAILTLQQYDAGGRLISIKKRLNDNTALERTIAAYTYDELGELKQRRLGVTSASTQLDSLTYEYNIHGWLKSINKAFVNTVNSTTNWFGQELSYDYGFVTNQVNGNIAGAKWKSQSDGISRAYGYTYDKADRLSLADFTQQNTGGGSWMQDQKDFTVNNLSYDANGNIVTMAQKGLVGTSSRIIDQLKYTYQPGTNKLIAVSDTSVTATAKLGDFINGTNTGDDYSYDGNGNLTSDLNKNISAITYNHLNLPKMITVTGKGSITYQYDANGNKLKKVVTDNTVSPAKVTTTDYLNGLVYQNDSLQLISHEEGRIRTVFKPGVPVGYVFDYFEKDHLGNVRMVLTEQTDFSMYAATMETEAAPLETALFSNVNETRTEKPVGYPQDNTTKQNTFVAKLNAKAGGNKIGPSLILRVMAGDTVQIGAKAFYKSTGPAANKKPVPAEDMLAGLVQAFGDGVAPDAVHEGIAGNNGTPFTTDFYNNNYQRLKQKDAPDEHKPRAYLNFVLFDDQFKLVEDNSGVKQVNASPDELQTLAVEKMAIKKSGFLYVYTSNETEQDVYFDNVSLGLATGPVLEETHYYPFGLTMEGISSQALKGANYAENRLRYNGKELQHKEFADGSGLELYDYGARMQDPQIGRFSTQDRFADKYYALTPYGYAANNPISIIDINGDSIWVTTAGNQRLYYGYTPGGGYGFYYNTITVDPVSGIATTKMNLYQGNDKFTNEVASALGRLLLGKEGKALVNSIADAVGKNVDIVQTAGGNQTALTGRRISWNPNGLVSGPNEKGSTNRPTFIGLAHELAHQQRIWNNTVNNNAWVTQDDNGNAINPAIPNDDIAATHVENKIRAENQIPLRTHYSVDVGGNVVNTTRILKRGTRASLYYNSLEQTNFKSLKRKQVPYKY